MARKKTKFWSEQEEPEEEPESRSSLKRKAHARVDLAELLVDSPPYALTDLPLSDEVLAQIAHARTIRQLPSKRRQVQFIAGMIDNDEAIREAMGGSKGPSARDLNMKDLDRWRTKILAGDDRVIDAFLVEHPEGDRQQIRQAKRAAAKEVEAGAMGKACKRLFALLRASG